MQHSRSTSPPPLWVPRPQACTASRFYEC